MLHEISTALSMQAHFHFFMLLLVNLKAIALIEQIVFDDFLFFLLAFYIYHLMKHNTVLPAFCSTFF